MASPLPLEELWQSALVNYGLERPAMILQTSLDKEACTRSITPPGPMSDPVQTLEQIISKNGTTWKLKRKITLGS